MQRKQTPRRILIVEDDAELRESVTIILEDEGHDVLVANDGLQALALLASEPNPDIILLDLMMPKMNGSEFREAQLKNPELTSIPVVLLTAHGVGEHELEKLHASAFVAKPFAIQVLLDIIDEISRRQTR